MTDLFAFDNCNTKVHIEHRVSAQQDRTAGVI